MTHEEETKLLADSRAAGFMNCSEIMAELFPDRRTSWFGAYNWIKGAGVKVSYLIPDGHTGVRKAERTGAWKVDFPKIKQHKEDWYAQAAVNSWDASVQGMVDAGYDRNKAVEMMPTPRPPEPSQPIDMLAKTKRQILDPQVVKNDTYNRVLAGLATYEGRRTRKDRPRRKPFSEHVGFSVTLKTLKAAWRERQEWKAAQVDTGNSE